MTTQNILTILTEALDFFCAAPRTPDDVLKKYAPDAVPAGGVLLTPGMPFFIRNEVMTSLRLSAPCSMVIWWRNPDWKNPADKATVPDSLTIKEIHLVLDAGERIVRYEDFVSAAQLGEGIKQPSTHPLSDILWYHRRAACLITVNQIVWQGAVVGKVGEFAVRR